MLILVVASDPAYNPAWSVRLATGLGYNIVWLGMVKIINLFNIFFFQMFPMNYERFGATDWGAECSWQSQS